MHAAPSVAAFCMGDYPEATPDFAQLPPSESLSTAGQELLQAPPQMTVLPSQAMPYPVTYQPQAGAVPGQMQVLQSNDYADLGE